VASSRRNARHVARAPLRRKNEVLHCMRSYQ
jgi:hypothetical protein